MLIDLSGFGGFNHEIVVKLPGGNKVVIDAVGLEAQVVQSEDHIILDEPAGLQLSTAEVVERFLTYQRARGLRKSTLDAYRSPLNDLIEISPEWPPSADALLDLFSRYNEYSKITQWEYWGWLNRVMTWCCRQDYLTSNPMRSVPRVHKKPIIEAGTIPPRDMAQIIKHLRQVSDMAEPGQTSLPRERAIRDLAIYRLAYSTGCRGGELVTLRLRDIDLDGQTVTLRGEITKSGKSRIVYFGRSAKRALLEWLDVRPDTGYFVFVGVHGNGWSTVPMTMSGLSHTWRRRQRDAGVGPYKFHEIRHSHVTHAQDLGVPLHHVSRQAGHASPDITARVYTHSADPDRRRAYEDRNPDDALEDGESEA